MTGAQRGDFERSPGGLREQIAEALLDQPVISSNHTVPITPRDAHLLADALLPLVSRHADQRAAEAKADLERRLTALADDFDELFRSERPGRTPCDHGIAYRRASLRLRDVLAGYEGSLFYGALPWLRARLTPPTENEEQQG